MKPKEVTMRGCKRKAWRAAVLLFALPAFLDGCGDDDTTAPQATPNPTVKVTITVRQVIVIAECEGTTGTNPGDFVFDLDFYTSDTSIETQSFSGSFAGLNNQNVDIPDIGIELNRVPPEDGWLYLNFSVTELDNGIPDPGMNDSRGLCEHRWPTGDVEEYFFTVDVSGSTRCSVRFVGWLKAERL
jgi:hypothetical protein